MSFLWLTGMIISLGVLVNYHRDTVTRHTVTRPPLEWIFTALQVDRIAQAERDFYML